MDDGPLIVISDTHFGFKPESKETFQHFIEWLARLETNGSETIQTLDGGQKSLKKAQKIILLGDMFDYLFPRKGDKTTPLRDGFTIFDRLISLPCEKIYVSGNHDEEIASYKGTYICSNDFKFDVFHGQYPEDEHRYLKVGNTTYFFLHGYQFDKALGNDVTRKTLEAWALLVAASPKLEWWIVPIVFILFLLWLRGDNFISLLRNVRSVVAVSLLFIRVVLWIIVGVSVLAWIGRRAQDLWYWIHPDHVRYDRRSYFDKFIGNAKFIDIDGILERPWYKEHKNTIAADVVVFGHTHFPQPPTRPSNTGKTFVNTGSWVPSEIHQFNTLVYIDEDGPLLLQWDDKKRKVHQLHDE